MVRHLRRRSCGLSDIGRRRETNEDAFVSDDTLGLYVVADGVGGQAAGEVASAAAVEQVHNYVMSSLPVVEDLIRRGGEHEPVLAARRLIESAVQSACYMVFGMGELEPQNRGMSTTLSTMLCAANLAIIGQVGDSRVYRMRNGQAAQLTEDHTLAQHKIKLGLVTPEQAKTMKGRNAITRAVGHHDYVQVDTFVVDLQPGDRYLLCSDGLHGYFHDEDVEELLAFTRVEDVARQAIELALDRGGGDNITAVVVSFSDFVSERAKRASSSAH